MGAFSALEGAIILIWIVFAAGGLSKLARAESSVLVVAVFFANASVVNFA